MILLELLTFRSVGLGVHLRYSRSWNGLDLQCHVLITGLGSMPFGWLLDALSGLTRIQVLPSVVSDMLV